MEGRSRAFEWKSAVTRAAAIGLSQKQIRMASPFSVAYDPDPTTLARITMLESRMAPILK
jgi:hypothetical protein